jgi:hypothetical protein
MKTALFQYLTSGAKIDGHDADQNYKSCIP